MDESEKPDRREFSADEVTERRSLKNQPETEYTFSSWLPPVLLFTGLIWGVSVFFESSLRPLGISLVSLIPPILLILLGGFLWLDQASGQRISGSIFNFLNDLHRRNYPINIPIKDELDSREAYFAFLGVSRETSSEALRFKYKWYSDRKLVRQFGLAVLSWVLLWMVIDFDPGLRKGVAVLKTPGAILLAAAGLGFIYSLLLTWVNQTELLFTKSGITVSHGPLPYVRRKELTMNQVVEIIPGQGQRTSIEGINRIYFKLIAVLADQREVLLVRFQDEDVVIFTWRAVEAWLRAENQNASSAARSMAK